MSAFFFRCIMLYPSKSLPPLWGPMSKYQWVYPTSIRYLYNLYYLPSGYLTVCHGKIHPFLSSVNHENFYGPSKNHGNVSHNQMVLIWIYIYAIYPIYPMAGRIGVTFGRTPRRAGAATIRTWAVAIGRRWSMWCRPMTATRASRTLAFFDGWMVLMIGWLDFSFLMGRVF